MRILSATQRSLLRYPKPVLNPMRGPQGLFIGLCYRTATSFRRPSIQYSLQLVLLNPPPHSTNLSGARILSRSRLVNACYIASCIAHILPATDLMQTTEQPTMTAKAGAANKGPATLRQIARDWNILKRWLQQEYVSPRSCYPLHQRSLHLLRPDRFLCRLSNRKVHSRSCTIHAFPGINAEPLDDFPKTFGELLDLPGKVHRRFRLVSG
jgi:hypothetical protein